MAWRRAAGEWTLKERLRYERVSSSSSPPVISSSFLGNERPFRSELKFLHDEPQNWKLPSFLLRLLCSYTPSRFPSKVRLIENLSNNNEQ